MIPIFEEVVHVQVKLCLFLRISDTRSSNDSYFEDLGQMQLELSFFRGYWERVVQMIPFFEDLGHVQFKLLFREHIMRASQCDV